MKNIARFALALGLVAICVWLWTVLFPSPERVITRQFEKLAGAASVLPDQGALARLASAQSVGNYLADNVEISIDMPTRQQQTTLSRDDIVQTMMAVHAQGGLTVKFPDISVTVAPDETSAQADVTVVAHGAGEQDTFVQEIRFTLRKIVDKWLITKVQTVRTLS